MWQSQADLKLRELHLYQIMAYLQNYSRSVGERPVEGLLLYPAVGDDFVLKYDIFGYPVTAAAIDLDQEWSGIERALLNLTAGISKH